MERIKILPRIMEARVRRVLERQKSVLLLGPRQTGKTTLLQLLQPDLLLNFLRPEVRQRYERAPQLLGAELEALAGRSRRQPLVALDEVQRVPELCGPTRHCTWRKKCGRRRWCGIWGRLGASSNWPRSKPATSVIFAASPRSSPWPTPPWRATTKSWKTV